MTKRTWAVLAMTTTLVVTGCGDDEDGDSDGHHHDGGHDGGHDKHDGGHDKHDAGHDSGHDAGPGSFTINFRAEVGDEAFACGTHYDDVGTPGSAATPVDLRFYVQDVHLVKADDTEVPLALASNEWQHENVAMLDFENGTGACDQGDTATNTAITGSAPPDDYVGLKFTIGVPVALNHADLSTLPSPLNKSGLFWGWNYGHIFLSAVARGPGDHDVDAGDEDAGAHGGHGGGGDHVTHVGSTGCDGDPAGGGDPVTMCTNPNRSEIVFADFDAGDDVVVVDFAAIKAGSSLMHGGPCHSFTADTCTAPFANLGIDFATGGPSSTPQTVFRKE